MQSLTPTPVIYLRHRKGRRTGQKLALKRHEIWAIRLRLQMARKSRDLALFNLAIDSKLRSCDLLKLRVSDITVGNNIASRATIIQQKTGKPVQFELTDGTREAVNKWIRSEGACDGDYLFQSRMDRSKHLSTRQYARIVDRWVTSIGLDPALYGTHSLRRTKVSLIYRQSHNLRAVQLLLGHTKIESTVRYLGFEIDDALELAESTEA